MTYRILVIDDEKTLADNICKFLARAGFVVAAAYSGQDGLEKFKVQRPSVVLLDMRLGDMDGLALLKEIRQLDSAVKVVLMTAYGSIDIAVEAMKAGANEFLTKPIVLKKVGDLIQDLLGRSSIPASEPQPTADYLDRIIGESPAIVAQKNRLQALLSSENAAVGDYAPPVLITGQTGTGKELLAQAIHYGGRRRKGPFIEINCTTLPENLVESELFGHEKGAFTGAPARKTGLFEAAQGGTLFLDEIGDMPMALQAKLLKAIEGKEIRPVGSTQSRKIDVRIMAATNKPLEELIAAQRFRADLYFRLSAFQLELPPLHQRANDVLLLADHFLELQARCYQKPKPRLSVQAQQAMLRHSWPGNVRELRNVLEQAMLLAQSDVIEPAQLALTNVGAVRDARPSRRDTDLNLHDSEKQLLLRALEKTEWNVTAAAKLLGISRDTLRYRIKRFDITSPSDH